MSKKKQTGDPSEGASGPIQALARAEDLLVENQRLKTVCGALCVKLSVKLDDAKWEEKLFTQLDTVFAGFLQVRESIASAKAWLRAISLLYPECRKEVNEALAELHFREFGADGSSVPPGLAEQ